MDKQIEEVNSLIAKGAGEQNALHALQFTQAALNAAHALITLAEMPKGKE